MAAVRGEAESWSISKEQEEVVGRDVGGGGVCCLGSPEIVEGIMKNSGGTSKQTVGHFLW